jgi:SAM-dependent methyltransferase
MKADAFPGDPARSHGLKLNIGCGQDVVPGYDGVDIVPGPNVRFVCDLETFPWTFEDDSVDEVLMDNILEHLSDTVRTMEEIHRILAPGGRAIIHVPYYNSYTAATDPTHKRLFSEDTMSYFTEDGVHAAYNYYSKARFRIRERTLIQRNRVLRRLPESVQLFFGHHLATISGIRWELEAIK